MDKKHVVLLVDDDELVLRALGRSLNRRFEVLTALSYNDALLVLRNTDVDVVVSDRRMGEPDGLALLEWLAQERPHVVRVLVSADPSPCDGTVERSLHKPAMASDVELAIVELLRSRGRT